MIGTAWTVENVEMCTAAASMASTLDPIIKWSRNDLLLLGPSAPCSFLPTFSLLACLLAAPTAYCTIADDQNRRIKRQNVDRTRTSYPSWLASSLLPPYSSVQLYSCAVIYIDWGRDTARTACQCWWWTNKSMDPPMDQSIPFNYIQINVNNNNNNNKVNKKKKNLIRLLISTDCLPYKGLTD